MSAAFFFHLDSREMLEPDRNQLEVFVEAIFRHAASRGFVAVRSFFDDRVKEVARLSSADLVGGLRVLVDIAEDDARRAAQHPRPIVFCPPLAVFSANKRAREQDIVEGLALSVECDDHPLQARGALEAILGPATVVVKSGGRWLNGGEPEDKLHLHWRLEKPARGGAELAKLKQARDLAGRLVGGDPSNKPVCHPIRWPGSWHRKAEPRLCLIDALDADRGIELEAALAALTAGASSAAGKPPPPGADTDRGNSGEWPALVGDIMSGKSYHAPLVSLAARLVGSHMHDGTAVKLLRGLMLASAAEHDDRWQARYEAIPRIVATAREKFARPPPNGSAETGEAPSRKGRANLILLEKLTMTPIVWIWEGWLAKGAIHLIAGVPEAGKTSIALKIAATLSSGDSWPDWTKAKPGHVLIWTGEDDPERTIKPRLIQMGADAKKISIVKGTHDEDGKLRPFNPSTDLPGLALTAKDIPGGIDLLIVDPIASVIGGKVDNSNNAGHREKLQPLVDFAEDMDCAVIGVTHFTKGTIGKDPIDRVTGSLAFGAVARVVFAATKNQSGEPERMFIMAKNNLGPTLGGFGYSIVGAPLLEDQRIIASRIVWGERLEGSARDLLAEAEDSGKDDTGAAASAQAFLFAALKDGERLQTDVAAEGGALGFSSTRLFRASKTLHIIKRRAGFGGEGGWMWRLP
jgi:putative DNA primase/helicase